MSAVPSPYTVQPMNTCTSSMYLIHPCQPTRIPILSHTRLFEKLPTYLHT